MLHYLLPALLPSWRFFDDVGPSPRLEYALLRYASDAPALWLPFPPTTPQLSFAHMLQRLGWNVQRNEALFVMSCCERELLRDSVVARAEIVRRLQQYFENGSPAENHSARDSAPQSLCLKPLCFVFRIRLVVREGRELIWHDAYLSSPQPLPGATA